jgi:EAL domain-containing protein (putative c-di-GMP-specific phosphodiesterase class I)
LAEDVAHALSSSGLNPSALIIEIAQSVVSGDSARVVVELRRVKALGVKIVIGDFGTAYSALAYLSQVPIDGLKIDKSFITTIEDATERGTLMHVLLELGKTLGLTTLVDGIDGSPQIPGVDDLLTQPLAPEALTQLFATQGT